MAKVRSPLFSAEVRGRVGGLCFNTWRGIATVKQITAPTGQGTTKRLAAQAKLSQWSKMWKQLTSTQRNTWYAYALVHFETDWSNVAKRITAQNWYIRCNVTLAILGQPAITSAPTTDAPDAPTGLVASYATAGVAISWTTPTYSTNSLMAFATPAQSAGRVAKRPDSQFVSYASASRSQPWTIIAAPTSGTYTLFVKSVVNASGLSSGDASSFVAA